MYHILKIGRIDPLPRTKSELETWYKKYPNLDPWNYNRFSHGLPRFEISMLFIAKHVGEIFNGTFLEIGAFQGNFTILLASAFPSATIVCNDISELALAKAKERCKEFSNIHYHCGDLLHISHDNFPHKDEKVFILMMECLYYLEFDERIDAVENIKRQFPSAGIIISTPIIGGNYFTELNLLSLFKEKGYSLKDFTICTTRSIFGLFSSIIIPFAQKSSTLRSIFINQVIFLFEPNDLQN